MFWNMTSVMLFIKMATLALSSSSLSLDSMMLLKRLMKYVREY
jgi:hypothetical protein